MSARQIVNPAGLGGTTDYPQTVDQYIASTAVTGPVVVALGTTGLVATAATNAPIPTIGIATNAVSAGRAVDVVTSGIAEGVPCDGAVAAGAIVKASATTAGRVAATATPAAGEAIGFAIAASASGTVDVYVNKTL